VVEERWLSEIDAARRTAGPAAGADAAPLKPATMSFSPPTDRTRIAGKKQKRPADEKN